MSLEDQAFGEARLRLGDVRLGAELLELRERILEQAVSVLEPPAPGHDPTEIRGRQSDADAVVRRAPDAQRLLEEGASLVELTPVGEDLGLVALGSGDAHHVTDARSRLPAAPVPVERVVPAPVEVRLDADVVLQR